MKLSAPKKTTFWIAVVVALLAVLATIISIPVVSNYTFFFLLAGFVILMLGNLLKGF